jgi:hypothetical protein
MAIDDVGLGLRRSGDYAEPKSNGGGGDVLCPDWLALRATV